MDRMNLSYPYKEMKLFLKKKNSLDTIFTVDGFLQYCVPLWSNRQQNGYTMDYVTMVTPKVSMLKVDS